MIRTPWTPAHIERAQAMWLAGRSAAAIGTALGVTRNAVIGKLSRLGVVRSGEAEAPVPAESVPPRLRPPARGLPPGKVRLRAAEPAPTSDLMALQPHMCRWPIGEPGEPGFGFCGRPAQGSFCPAHRRRAYQPGPLEPIERLAGLEPRPASKARESGR
jgi:GcrA cell cycle regulator